jgi:hypothetical protein
VSPYPATPIARWLQAVGVAAAYVVVAAAILWLDLGDGGVAPVWAALAVPPFYGVLSLVMLRRASPARYMSWVGTACLTHVALGLAAAAAFTMVVDVTVLSALAHAFARLGPVPALTLVATPLVLTRFQGRSSSTRPAFRRVRERRPAAATSGLAAEIASIRDFHQRESEPQERGSESHERESERHERENMREAPPARRVAKLPVSTAAPVRADVAAIEDVPDDGSVIRVRFERVAGQLPAGAFTLPFDRLSESLRDPHWLTIPKRVVLAQLPEGAVQVDWGIVASQFPPLALAMSEVEFRQKYPGLKLTLPLDDLVRQLPPGTFPMPPAPTQIAGLEAFPPPFQPLAVPRDQSPAGTPAAPTPAAPVVAPPPPPPVMTPPAPVVAPPAATVIAPPPVPVVAPPPPAPVAAPPRRSSSTPPPPLASPPPTPAVAPVSAARHEPTPEVVSRDVIARLAACLTGTGTFESWAGIVEGTTLVAFVAPTMPRDAVAAVGVRIAALLGAAAGEQVTVRTARAAIVVSAAPIPLVIAARRPGAPVALLELRAARAASLIGRASEGAALPARALAALKVEPRVAGVARTLAGFGVVEPAVLSDAGGGASVYVFREPGREAEHLGALALAVWDVVGRTHDELGALVSVVFRQGRRRIFVRPVGGRGTALLAAAGLVARPGRAWRDADRAAAALESR